MRPLHIGILTYHFSDNFGALMQAYGLKKWLADCGHSVEFINYHPTHVEDGGVFRGLFDPRNFKANIKVAYLKLTSVQRRIFGRRTQNVSFEEFRGDVLSVAGPRLYSKGDVTRFVNERSPAFDVIVLGSDQIWASSVQHGLDPVYYGDFPVPAATRRISYAPSFGRASVDSEHCGEIARYLHQLDGISVRERSGVSLVKALTGLEVACVPDPTLLLDNYRAAINAAEPTSTGHVFCYALRTGAGIRNVAEKVGNELRAPVISPYNVHRRWREIGTTVYPSPQGWIASIERSAFVVTNSFHGTVFSALLRKPFVVVGLGGKRSGLNERALNLLDEIGLRDRFVDPNDLEAAHSLISAPIDWESVSERVASLRQSGRDYLREQLGASRS